MTHLFGFSSPVRLSTRTAHRPDDPSDRLSRYAVQVLLAESQADHDLLMHRNGISRGRTREDRRMELRSVEELMDLLHA